MAQPAASFGSRSTAARALSMPRSTWLADSGAGAALSAADAAPEAAAVGDDEGDDGADGPLACRL
jgi:hypothetical protein